MTSFRIVTPCSHTQARAGVLDTTHGPVPTPAFLPVGSQATVKTLVPRDLDDLGVRMVLANTYHLYLRPGPETIRKLGGLHRFMAWEGPILTDSGGYQVFSLAPLRRVSDQGVTFRSHIDGSEHFFTPELAVELQEGLGADIIMALDVPSPFGAPREEVARDMERTHGWAGRCLASRAGDDHALFGIVQGGTFPELRRSSAEFLASLDFPGYALGGLCLGEPKELMMDMVEVGVSPLPPDRPRYLMGVGSPEDLVAAVARGVDLFDSALPTRVARNGALFTHRGRINIRNASFRERDGPIDSACDCTTCRTFSVAYLHHLFRAGELLGLRLATVHNLRFIMVLMEAMRQSVLDGGFEKFKDGFLSGYIPADEKARLAQRRDKKPS